jgi:hypothetical protein
MKIVFIVYHDILEDRVTNLLNSLKIDYYTEWENVKGKGHTSDAHLGNRTFPGYNSVRMIAFQTEDLLNEFILGVEDLNKLVQREDDNIRLFQIPLERII